MFVLYDTTNMKKERIVSGVDLQRIREGANLTRRELATRLGDGGYKAGNVTIYETENRYVGLTLLKQWARARGYQIHVVFERDPAVPTKPAPHDCPPAGSPDPVLSNATMTLARAGAFAVSSTPTWPRSMTPTNTLATASVVRGSGT